jgi:hypothetical protein
MKPNKNINSITIKMKSQRETKDAINKEQKNLNKHSLNEKIKQDNTTSETNTIIKDPGQSHRPI